MVAPARRRRSACPPRERTWSPPDAASRSDRPRGRRHAGGDLPPYDDVGSVVAVDDRSPCPPRARSRPPRRSVARPPRSETPSRPVCRSDCQGGRAGYRQPAARRAGPPGPAAERTRRRRRPQPCRARPSVAAHSVGTSPGGRASGRPGPRPAQGHARPARAPERLRRGADLRALGGVRRRREVAGGRARR